MCLTMLDNAKMNSKYYDKCKSYVTSEILWEIVHDQAETDTTIHK